MECDDDERGCRLPKRLLTPAPDVADRHRAPDLELQMKEFYEVAGGTGVQGD